MNTQLIEMLQAADGRYLTREEQQTMLRWSEGLSARFQAATFIAAKEDVMVKEVIELLKAKYPNMGRYHADGWEKGYRDMQLVLRYMVRAMILEDVQDLDDKLLYWFRTILRAVNLTPKFIKDAYELLRQVCQRQLPADVFQRLDPVIVHTISVLSDFPEPHIAAV